MLKKTFFSALLCVLILVIFELFSLGSLRLLEQKGLTYRPISLKTLTEAQRVKIDELIAGQTKYLEFDADLGWALKRSASFGHFATNEGGFRGTKDYSLVPESGKIRIAAFGDSFVHGDDVTNQETWQSQLEGQKPGLEVLNFGVSGYGIDQAYLRYLKDGRAYNPRIVVIGFVSENMRRMVNTFRPFYQPGTELPLTKPRFEMADGKLKLLKNPLLSLEDYRQLRQHEGVILQQLRAQEPYLEDQYSAGPFDALAMVRLFKVLYKAYGITPSPPLVKDHYYNPDSKGFQLTLKVIDAFYQDVLKNNGIPVIVIFPTTYDVERKEYHLDSSYHYIKEAFRKEQYRYIDLLDRFPEGLTLEEIRTYFGPTLHYSAKGNALVAEKVLEYLEQNDLLRRN